MLEVLDAGKIRLRDVFPTWLGSLHDLQVIVLNHNNFYGRITGPESDLNFGKLRIIDLSYNCRTGDLPALLFRQWPAMRVPSEDQSDVSKTIINFYFEMNEQSFYYAEKTYNYSITCYKDRERFFSRVSNVFRVVEFLSNDFTGKVPDNIGDLKGLQALNLSNNNLNGIILGPNLSSEIERSRVIRPFTEHALRAHSPRALAVNIFGRIQRLFQSTCRVYTARKSVLNQF
ncbi:hypothetical protein RND81_02G062200 [Saponaria officinalis]|uniref:Uncharacterized protein n=1 Tax=Saponaria officinalis TaxID=3572 RepID=A0AAW1ML01_SAPOF